MAGLEPATAALTVRGSTIELHPNDGGGSRIRTDVMQLMRLPLVTTPVYSAISQAPVAKPGFQPCRTCSSCRISTRSTCSTRFLAERFCNFLVNQHTVINATRTKALHPFRGFSLFGEAAMADDAHEAGRDAELTRDLHCGTST